MPIQDRLSYGLVNGRAERCKAETCYFQVLAHYAVGQVAGQEAVPQDA